MQYDKSEKVGREALGLWRLDSASNMPDLALTFAALFFSWGVFFSHPHFLSFVVFFFFFFPSSFFSSSSPLPVFLVPTAI
jgi:hypothetical protein